ncbi:MAG: signal recognition particle-docking protein FtsY, partial [Mesorhizobium sp.]
MAFGFIKKVFSFGRKEVVEDKAADEAAPLPPLNLDALEGLKPAEETPSSPPDEGSRAKAESGEEAFAPSLPAAPSSGPSGHLLPGGEKGESPAFEPAEQPTTEPEPAPVEVPQEPEPVEPAPDEKPAPEPEPAAEPVPEEEPAP